MGRAAAFGRPMWCREAGSRRPIRRATTVFDGVSAFAQRVSLRPAGNIVARRRRVRAEPERSGSDASIRVRHGGRSARAPDQRPASLGRIVLVGHSLGGLLVRLFAARYPDEVAGMVLVDAFSAELWTGLAAALAPEHRAALEALEQEPRKELMTVYPEVEFLDLDAVVAEEIAAMSAHPIPPVPTIVLSRGRSLEGVVPPDAVPPGFPWEVVEQVSRAAQASLGGLVPGARHGHCRGERAYDPARSAGAGDRGNPRGRGDGATTRPPEPDTVTVALDVAGLRQSADAAAPTVPKCFPGPGRAVCGPFPGEARAFASAARRSGSP